MAEQTKDAETCHECLDPDTVTFCDKPAVVELILWPGEGLSTRMVFCEPHGHAEHTELLLREDIKFRYGRLATTQTTTGET